MADTYKCIRFFAVKTSWLLGEGTYANKSAFPENKMDTIYLAGL